ncbi:MAG: hypothetical protein WCV87_03765 [Candidatus Paceibacterota bacterium]|jgi:hypothetical protein
MSNENAKKSFMVGGAVRTKKFGDGTLVKVDELGIGAERHPVYHVRLKNQDVRHFVEGEVTAL